MTTLVLDTATSFDARLVNLNSISLELMSLTNEFSNVLDADRWDMIYSDIDEPKPKTNPFNPSLEEAREGYANTNQAEIHRIFSSGVKNKLKNMVVDGTTTVATGTAKAVKPATGGLIKLAKLFMEKIATLMNSISTMLSKVLATGYPLMGSLISQAGEVKMLASRYKSRADSEFEFKKASKFLMVGDTVADPRNIINHLNYVNDVQSTLLSKEKLNRFKNMSAATLEPYRSSIKGSKTDSLVFTIAVIGTLINPGVVVGAVLKKIFSAANPGLGNALDIGSKVVGGGYLGEAALLLSTGATATSYLKQIQNGKLDISNIPHFAQIYPFCDKVDEKSNGGLFVTHKSEILLGNRQWTVRDYTDTLTAEMKGSVSDVGAKFTAVKTSSITNTVKTLSSGEINAICDLVIDMMTNAQAYCKQWPVYSKVYNELYRNVSDIVMTYNPSDDKALTAKYIRYSYRNAMNGLLGGIWSNCFGSDNQFVRYLVSLCRTLILYCKESLDLKNEISKDEDKEEKEDKV